MDDFYVNTLHQSKNEWAANLLNILTPLVIEGMKSIFNESVELCKGNDQQSKYLMTFQNFIKRIPKWNPAIVETERKRIVDKSGCAFLEDLITCIHIIHLKLLSAIRVGQKQKKIDINIPKLDDFIHKVYIHAARKIYSNVYLFELEIPPLQVQKNQRELELLIQEAILNSIRESIPVEALLRAYMDESEEVIVKEEIKEIVKEKDVSDEDKVKAAATAANKTEIITETKNDAPAAVPALESSESLMDMMNKSTDAPITNPTSSSSSSSEVDPFPELNVVTETLASKPTENANDYERIKISDETVDLGAFDVHVIDPAPVQEDLSLKLENFIDDIEILA